MIVLTEIVSMFSKIDNTIVIAPSVETINKCCTKYNIYSFHEIDERNISNINFRGGVIDYENYARKIIGLPIRPFGLNHSKTVRTNYK